MKLFSGKVDIIAAEITRSLLDGEDIATETPQEVELDIAAILKEYIRLDRVYTEKAKDECESKSLPYSSFAKVKRQMAERGGFSVGDEAVDYLMDQIIGSFLHSENVEEVFSEDHEMKVKMRTIIKRHTDIEEEIDSEARNKIKNLQEGTRDWEIEYRKAMEQVKRRRGLT